MALEQVLHLSSTDRDTFARVVRLLLKDVFLLRVVDAEEQLYSFALRNFAALEEWFAFVGLSVLKDEGLGVITFRGDSGGRSTLNLDETLGLLVLIVLYNEKRNELSLRSEVTVQQVEFLDRFRVLTERTISKTRFILMLRRLQSMKFLRVHGEAEDPGALLVLYPSIPFVLDGRDIEELFVTILADSDEEADDEADEEADEEADDEAGGKEESGVPDGIDSLDDPEGPADSEDIETIDDPENTPRRANAQGDTAAPAAPHASSAAAAPAAPHAPSAAPHNRRNP
jgi:hypothetical protein